MPYINNGHRIYLEDHPLDVKSTGELNYMITGVIAEYLERNGLSYAVINNIMGALEGAKLEFYRRVAAPYENKKILENGDVYPKGYTE